MKYVEAMIQPLGSGAGVPVTAKLDNAVAALSEYVGGFEGEPGREAPKWSRVIELARTVEHEYEAFTDRLDDHECGEEAGPFIPIGSTESIDTLLRREGFNSADMVAIVKLADLEHAAKAERFVLEALSLGREHAMRDGSVGGEFLDLLARYGLKVTP